MRYGTSAAIQFPSQSNPIVSQAQPARDAREPETEALARGYYVPKGAQEATRHGVAAWQEMQERLRELAELNKDRNLRRAREAHSR